MQEVEFHYAKIVIADKLPTTEKYLFYDVLPVAFLFLHEHELIRATYGCPRLKSPGPGLRQQLAQGYRVTEQAR